MTALLLCAWAHIPTRCIRLFLEVNAVPIRLRQVLRVDDFYRYDQERVAAGYLKKIEVLGERGVRAIRHAVAHQVPWLRLRRYDFERGSRCSTSSNREAAQCRRRPIPGRDGNALPVIALRAWRAEGQKTCLRSGLRFDFQRVVCIPRDVQASGHMHDAANAICFARVFRCGVFFRIPRGCNPSAFCADGYAADIALWRRRHAIAPVFSHLPNPISGEVERRIPAPRSSTTKTGGRTLPPHRADEDRQTADSR